MTGVIRITALIVRIARLDPMTMPMGRVTVISADPGVLAIAPFIMPRDPDRRVIGAGPLLVVLLRRRWRLIANVKAYNLSVTRGTGDKACDRRDRGHGQDLDR